LFVSYRNYINEVIKMSLFRYLTFTHFKIFVVNESFKDE